ncbi:MAG TPA: riboflavin synthase [Acetivibrio sp.]|nr:riboflavin synthase [Acetivibrio sp.]
MFTGIIEEIGIVDGIKSGSMSVKLSIKCRKIMDDVKIGDSISVNGICLTVTSRSFEGFTADVMPETMRRTNLGRLKTKDKVNIERALRLNDRLGGHIVSGHIDGTGVISDKGEEDNAIWLEICAAEDILRYIVQKGSVALDGTSLTVAYVDDKCFRVSLIPHTAGVTTLGTRKIGDIINIECDMLGKYVEKLIKTDYSKERNTKKELTMDFLRENGFV